MPSRFSFARVNTYTNAAGETITEHMTPEYRKPTGFGDSKEWYEDEDSLLLSREVTPEYEDVDNLMFATEVTPEHEANCCWTIRCSAEKCHQTLSANK